MGQVNSDPEDWILEIVPALSTPFPTGTTEKRWVNGVPDRKKRLGL